MGEIPEYNFDDLDDSGNHLEEHSFEFSGGEFSFTMADVRNAIQVKKELKEAQLDLAAVRKENAEYKKMLEELREERDLEYNARRTAKNKCYWLKQMYGGLVEFMLDLLGHLETEKKGRRGRGGILKTGDLKMLKRIPAQLKPLIARLEDAKVKEDFRGFDVALEKVMKSARDLQTKLRGDEDPEDNAWMVGDGGSDRNDIVEPTAIPIPVPMSTEVEVDPDVDVVPMETVDEEQEVQPLETRHAVNPKNSRECLCGYTSSPSKVKIHVRRVTIDLKNATGSFVCPVCGDKLVSKRMMQRHLTCHKSPKPVPIAPVQSNDSSEDDQLVGSAMVSGGQSPTNKVIKSGAEVTPPSSSSSAKTPKPQVEMDEDDQANATDQRTLRSATCPKRKHLRCPGNPHRCSCGFTSRNVRHHIWRVTVGKHSTSGAYICKLCGDRFRYKIGLNRHMARHRTSPSPTPNAGLRKAIPVVVQTEADEDDGDGEMPVLTQQCPASWIAQDVTPGTTTTDVQEDASSVPLVRSPNKYTNVKCPSCGQRFPFRCHLWKHCMQVHNVRIPASTPPHECHLCKESFKKYADYFLHHFSAHLDSMEKKI